MFSLACHTDVELLQVEMKSSSEVCVLLCGLSGHGAMKGLRRERGEHVVLRFTFHSSQPFLMTLASTHCTYVALRLNMCVCASEHVCVSAVYSMRMREGLCIIIRENQKKSSTSTSVYSSFPCWTAGLSI